jgi:hypothetical protein
VWDRDERFWEKEITLEVIRCAWFEQPLRWGLREHSGLLKFAGLSRRMKYEVFFPDDEDSAPDAPLGPHFFE